MVAVGSTSDGETKNVEVIDLKNLDMICQDLPDYPFAIKDATTFLNFDEQPEICGGVNKKESIYYKASFIFLKQQKVQQLFWR